MHPSRPCIFWEKYSEVPNREAETTHVVSPLQIPCVLWAKTVPNFMQIFLLCKRDVSRFVILLYNDALSMTASERSAVVLHSNNGPDTRLCDLIVYTKTPPALSVSWLGYQQVVNVLKLVWIVPLVKSLKTDLRVLKIDYEIDDIDVELRGTRERQERPMAFSSLKMTNDILFSLLSFQCFSNPLGWLQSHL